MNGMINYKRTLLFCFLLMPTLAFADENKPQSSMPKDAWVKKVKKEVPQQICDGFFADPTISEKLKKSQFTQERCIQELPKFTEKCINDYYKALPQDITPSSSKFWGKTLGECIGGEFAKTYLVKANNSPKMP